MAACTGGILRDSIAKVVRAEIPIVAISNIDAAIVDLVARTFSTFIANITVCTRVTIVAAVARLWLIRAAVYRVADLIFGANVAIVAVDLRTFVWWQTPAFLAVAVMVNGASVVVAT
jgi:hypothetical protein